MGDLSEVEIDNALDRFKGHNFVILKAGSVKKENEMVVNNTIKESSREGRTVYMPFWSRHHWLACVIHDNIVKVFDSAPSQMVREDLDKWCTKRKLKAVFQRCPQQRRYSRECGIFVIGFIIGNIFQKEFRTGVISLEHLRSRLHEGEEPCVEMFENMFALNGGGEASTKSLHDAHESFAAQRNLCFLLTAMCIIRRGMEEKGVRNKPSISEGALIETAKQLGYLKTNTIAEENDVEDALYKLAKKHTLPIVPITEMERVPVGETVIVLKGDESINMPSVFRILAAAKFTSAHWANHISKDGTNHRTALKGHYRYDDKSGTVVLVTRIKGVDKKWSLDAEMKKKQGTTINTQPATCPLNPVDVNPKPIRHGRVSTVARMNQQVIGHWILGDATVRLVGKCVDDVGERPKMRWTHKQCNCGDWAELDEPVVEICPIPGATYIEFSPLNDVPVCSCFGDDDDEDRSGIGGNAKVDEQWREQESMEPLGTICRQAPLSMITGGVGRNWKIITKGKPKKVHNLVWNGLAESTRKKHVEWLKHINEMPADLHEESFDRAVVEMVMRIAKERKWAWSTVSCILSTVHSAVRLLDIYTTETKNFNLKESEYFSAAMKRAQKLARNAGPSTQLSTPMSFETMIGLFKTCQNLQVRTLLIMSWTFAARVGDMRQVEAKNITLPSNNKSMDPTAITFKKGKGGAFWGAYTIHAVLPLDAWKDVCQVMKLQKSSESMWSTGDQRKLSELVASAGLNLRSIRRGALLYNAHRGVSDTDLQYLSGHKRMDTLMRYLGWGVESSSAKKAAQDRHHLTGGENSDREVEPKKMGNHSGYQGRKGKRIEKPPVKYHFRPPTSQQLGIKKDAKKLPLHVKHVGLANIPVIKEMAAESKKFGEDCLLALRHLTGEPYKKYQVEMPHKKNIPKAGFTAAQVETMVEFGKLEPLEGTGKAWVKGFPIVDGHKERARPLAEPYVNALAERKIDFPVMSYTSTSEQYMNARDAVYAAQFDFAAYFDQFGLEKEAQEYMVLRTVPFNKNTMWKLTRLPMGATFSPCIAQFVTWVLCDPITEITGVKVTTMIDNVRIVATTSEGFTQAVRMFLERSDRAGLTLNPDAIPYRTDDDAQLLKIGRNNVLNDFEFLGVCYNNNTIRNSKRLVVKMTAAEKLLDSNTITRRQLAHIIGLAIFMAHTINEDLVHHFELMRLYNKLFEGNPSWDETFIPNEILKEKIRCLAKICIDNRRTDIRVLRPPSADYREYDAIVVFDACKDAWAAKIHLVKKNTRLRIMKRFEKQIKFSAHAEPTAAKEILLWLKQQFPEVKKAALVTDHKALAMGQKRWWTGYGGHSTAFHINEAFKEINNYADVFYVEGEHNICDEDSRSEEARRCSEINVRECNEKWYGLENCTHPYIDTRKNFIYF